MLGNRIGCGPSYGPSTPSKLVSLQARQQDGQIRGQTPNNNNNNDGGNRQRHNSDHIAVCCCRRLRLCRDYVELEQNKTGNNDNGLWRGSKRMLNRGGVALWMDNLRKVSRILPFSFLLNTFSLNFWKYNKRCQIWHRNIRKMHT